MATKTINTRLVIKHDTAANWTTNDPVLLLGEIGIDTTNNRMRIGDGSKKWSQLANATLPASEINSLISGSMPTTTIDNYLRGSSTKNPSTIIAALSATAKKGDFLIIEEYDSDDGSTRYGTYVIEQTAYVFNGTTFEALTGNVDAEHVYLKDDITVTTKIGTIQTLVDGKATWSTRGKNVKEALSSLVAQQKNPTITNPTASFKSYSGISNATVEPGTTKTGTVSYELQLDNMGTYEYGPTVAGVTAQSYSLSYNVDGTTGTKDTKSGSFTYNFVVGTSNKEVKVTASSVGYSAASNYAKDNLGNTTTLKVNAGTASCGTKTNTFTSSRKSFWTVDNITGVTLDSAKIRAFANSAFGTKKSYSLTIAEGTNRVVIAVPGSQTMKSCIDVDGMGLDVKDNFSSSTISVGGADATAQSIGSFATNYTVFLLENLAGLKKTTYNVTLN